MTLPKFHNTEMLDLTSVARALGLSAALSRRRADFSGVAELVSRRLYISDDLQKTHVDLDEKGSEAAAATMMIVRATAARDEPPPEGPIEFDADHRFIYLIRDEKTGDILFIGRMANRQWQ